MKELFGIADFAIRMSVVVFNIKAGGFRPPFNAS